MINPNKTFDELTDEERKSVWGIYRNACTLCVSPEARFDPKLKKQREDRADSIYKKWARFIDASLL